jgi:hypothetical protein
MAAHTTGTTLSDGWTMACRMVYQCSLVLPVSHMGGMWPGRLSRWGTRRQRARSAVGCTFVFEMGVYRFLA